MSLTSQDFYGHGFNTDMISGWEAQVAYRTAKVEIVWPAHLTGKRVVDFRRGARIARAWMNDRIGIGAMRRSERAKQLREQGGITLDGMTFCENRPAEQRRALERCVEFERKVEPW